MTSERAVQAALESWFAVTLKGTKPEIRDAVYDSHRDRMRDAISAAQAVSIHVPESAVSRDS